MAKRPAELTYWVDERPSLAVTALLAVQHLAIVAIYLVVAVTIARLGRLPAEDGVRLVCLTMVAGGIGSILQSAGRFGIGSGFLIPTTTTTILLPPSFLALERGGLPLLFGMTVMAGAAVALLSRLIHRMRPLLPAELAGFVVFMVGLSVMALAERQFLGHAVAEGERAGHRAVAVLTLAVIVAASVWGGRRLRLFCTLIGIAAGYGMAALTGRIGADELAGVAAAPLLAAPDVGGFGLAFDGELAVPFLAAALAMALNAVGAVTAAQKANDAAWVRPDMRNIGRGVLADGLCNMLAGLVGGVGQAATSGAVGLSVATGATSRVVGVAIGLFLLALSFSPKVAMLLLVMPPPVIGAALMFSGCFLVMNGIQVIASRLLDSRKVFTLGIALAFGLGQLVQPAHTGALPGWLAPLVGSPLALAVTLAVLLNALFRIGIHKRSRFRIDVERLDVGRLADFMMEQGRLWGASPETLFRARFATQEVVETLADNRMIADTGHAAAQRPVEVRTRFDEFTFTVTVAYAGEALHPRSDRPSEQEVLSAPDGARRLAAFLIGRAADRVTTATRHDRCEITLVFNA